ncbi:MAG: hypothetical protein ACRDN6_11215 [Gaiellaceae bacterium]
MGRMSRIVVAFAAALLLGWGGTTALATFAPDASPSGAAQAEANLLANPGAEAGEGATDANGRFPVPGWETTSTFTAVRYGAPQFPTPAESARIAGGANFLAGGQGAAVATATQTVNVSGRAAEIDAGRLAATLAAWLGGFAGQNDATTIVAVYLAATNAELGRTSIGPVTAADRGSQTSFRLRSATAPVPAGTRTIQVVLTARRMEGSYNDGYADNVSLTLGPGTPTPVAGVSVNLAPVSGVVRVRLRGTNRFVSLARLRNVPVGSELDVTRGRVRLVSAAGGAQTQAGVFYAGRGIVRQPRGRAPVTTLQLSGPLACPKRSTNTSGAPPPRKRRLWGNAKGRFRTSGRFASAAVRGTIWLTEDRCDGTLVRVRVGLVAVFDVARKRTVLVRAGQSYFARARAGSSASATATERRPG